MHEEGAEHKSMGSLYLSPSMLPEGMKANPGDILEFKVVGTDQDGDIEITYNTGKDGKDDTDSWADDLKHDMSARTPESETQ